MDTQIMGATLPQLPNIDDVPPISEQDRECLRELKEVLRKYDRLSRFGISLLHQHFPMSEDEILVEVCDSESRTLTTRPIKQPELADMQGVETGWRLDTEAPLGLCERICRTLTNGLHTMRHRPFDFGESEE